MREADRSRLGTAPMDIGAVHKAPMIKAEDRNVSGASKGSGFKGNCFTCGEQGHRSTNCAKSKGKGKASGQHGVYGGKG